MKLIDTYSHLPGARHVATRLHAQAGRADEARAEIEHLSGDDLVALAAYKISLVPMALLAHACAVVGDAAHSATRYALLEPYASHLLVDRNGPTCLGSVSLILGLLAETIGRCDDALRHLDEALAAHRRIGSPPWIANTQHATAAALLARNRPGDRERAGALLTEVLQTTEKLGMRRLQRHALALQERMNAGIIATRPDSKLPPLEKGGQGGFPDRPNKSPSIPLCQNCQRGTPSRPPSARKVSTG